MCRPSEDSWCFKSQSPGLQMDRFSTCKPPLRHLQTERRQTFSPEGLSISLPVNLLLVVGSHKDPRTRVPQKMGS